MSYTAKFPIYSLAFHQPTGTLILGGGGGPSRSGVPNGFLVLRLVPEKSGKNIFKFEEVGELRTGDEAVMSLSIYDDKTDCLIVAGVNDRCWLLELENILVNPSKNRVSSIVNALNNGQNPNQTTAPLNLLRTIQSDASPNDDGYLRVTRFTSAGRSFLAAGSDGSVREWAVPEMRLLSKAGDDSEILDTDKNEKYLAFVSSSGTIQLNSSKDSEPIVLKPTGDDFSFKLVRFHKNFLIAVQNFKPLKGKKLSRKNPKLVIFNFDQEPKFSLKPFKTQSLPISKNCTCIFFLNNSDHLALGFADGSLLVLSMANPSMVFLSKKEAHPFPVTGLSIDPVKKVLISSSADGQILINQIPSNPVRISYNSTIILSSILILIFSVFLFFSLNKFKIFNEIDDFDSFYNLFPSEIEL